MVQFILVGALRGQCCAGVQDRQSALLATTLSIAAHVPLANDADLVGGALVDGDSTAALFAHEMVA